MVTQLPWVDFKNKLDFGGKNQSKLSGLWINLGGKKSTCNSFHFQFSHSVVSDSWWPNGLQHARPPCPSPTPGVHQTHVHRVSDAIQSSHPLSSPSPPALNLSSIRVFSNESALYIRWPKDWSFSFNISPSNEQSGLISFRMDWLDLLAVQGTLKSLLHTTVQKHQFFSTQLSL